MCRVHPLTQEVVAVTPPRNSFGEMTLSRHERMTQTEELLCELPRSADRHDIEDRLIRINMPVARDVARRYEGRGIAADDLEQVAYVGLVKAVQHYDGAKATEFLSYAVPTIRGEVRRWFRDGGWMVRPPRSVQELQARVTRARDDLAHELGRPPTVEEIAEHLEVDTQAARAAMAANGCFTPSSLDAPSVGRDGDGDELADRLGGAEAGFAQVEARVVLGPLLRRLDERERMILDLRFVQGATQAEIGQRLGVTQTQVSRLLSTLLLRLRHELEGAPTSRAA
jgi:RNA polymerase sigma-B factor